MTGTEPRFSLEVSIWLDPPGLSRPPFDDFLPLLMLWATLEIRFFLGSFPFFFAVEKPLTSYCPGVSIS